MKMGASAPQVSTCDLDRFHQLEQLVKLRNRDRWELNWSFVYEGQFQQCGHIDHQILTHTPPLITASHYEN